MVKVILRGIAIFVALLIGNALMKILGEPLIDLIPPGAWALTLLQSAVHWAGTVDAVFWFLALGAVLLAVSVYRSRFLSLLSTAVVIAALALGVILGAWYRLAHLDRAVENVAADPAFWLVVAGVVSPVILWAVRRGLEELVWVFRDRREQAADPVPSRRNVSGADNDLREREAQPAGRTG